MLSDMALFLAVSEVRDYLQQTSTTGRFSDAQIGSNIRAAQSYLQRRTGRQFENQTATTKTFTTLNRAIVNIPDLRTATTVTKTGSVTTDYDLLPDRMSSGVYTGIQFRVPYVSGGDWYKSDPLWWDKNLDRPNYAGGVGYFSSEPNDLTIEGDWGYTGDGMPYDVLHAVKLLASFYTLRPQSVLAGASVTPEGALLTYRELPIEVRTFIEEWSLGEQAAVVVGL